VSVRILFPMERNRERDRDRHHHHHHHKDRRGESSERRSSSSYRDSGESTYRRHHHQSNNSHDSGNDNFRVPSTRGYRQDKDKYDDRFGDRGDRGQKKFIGVPEQSEQRRMLREQIGERGVPDVWGTSPSKLIPE